MLSTKLNYPHEFKKCNSVYTMLLVGYHRPRFRVSFHLPVRRFSNLKRTDFPCSIKARSLVMW